MVRRPLKLTGWELWLCGASNGPLFAPVGQNLTAFDGSAVVPEVCACVSVCVWEGRVPQLAFFFRLMWLTEAGCHLKTPQDGCTCNNLHTTRV